MGVNIIKLKDYLTKIKRKLEKTRRSSSDGFVNNTKQKEAPKSNLSEKEKKDQSQDFINNGELSAAFFAFLSQGKLLSWLGELTKAHATIYDKALDMEYLKNHIGGGITGFLMEVMTSSMLGAE